MTYGPEQKNADLQELKKYADLDKFAGSDGDFGRVERLHMALSEVQQYSPKTIGIIQGQLAKLKGASKSDDADVLAIEVITNRVLENCRAPSDELGKTLQAQQAGAEAVRIPA